MRNLVFAAVLLLLVTNAVVLSGVAYNRGGEPVGSIDLTERELTIVQTYSSADENSGTALSLRWQVPGGDEPPAYRYARGGSPEWLDAAKLSELGFTPAQLKCDREQYLHKWRSLTREVVLVLEYNGEAYRQALLSAEKKVNQLRESLGESAADDKLAKKLEQYEKSLTRLKVAQTRLYVVDAGVDEQALAEKYAGGKQYLLLRGDIGLGWNDDAVTGRIERVYVQEVHVPLPYSQQLASLTKGKRFYTYNAEPVPPRYQVQLDIGNRLEPWIASVSPIAGSDQGQ